MKAWVIYTRVSTDEQAREGVSLDAQRKACRGFLGFQSLPIAEEIEDAGESGKNLKRPGMQKVLKLIEDEKVGGLVIYRLDRMTRSVQDLYHLLTLLDRHKVSLQSVSEKIDTSTAMGRFFVTLIALIAQWERETIAERVKMGINHRRQQGGYIGGPAPAGTVVVGEKGKRVLQVDPRWKDVAAHAWTMAAEGKTLGEIAEYLTTHELRPRNTGDDSRSTGAWYKNTLHYWLTNANLVGLLVDRETFTKAGAMLKSRANPMRSNGTKIVETSRIWPLKGLARCLHCGAAMIGFSSKGRNGTQHYYLRCTTKQKSRTSCDHPDLPAIECERAVIEAVADAVQSKTEIVEQLSQQQARALAKCADAEKQIAALRMDRDGIKQQISRVVDLAARGALVADACQEKLVELQTESACLDHQIAELEGIQAAAAMNGLNNEFIAEQIKAGVERLVGASAEEVARGLAFLVKEVRLSADAVEVDLWPQIPDGLYDRAKKRSLLDRAQTVIRIRRELTVRRQGRGQQWVIGLADKLAPDVVG